MGCRGHGWRAHSAVTHCRVTPWHHGSALQASSQVHSFLQDIDEALKRIPQEEVDARNQRLKRAHDISLKKEYLPPHLQAQQTPYLSYVQVPRPTGHGC